MKIIVFADENLSLTGGNLYDTLLYKTMKQDPSYLIDFYKPIIHKSGFVFKKLITPFIELKYLKKVKSADSIFWNSVDAYHCFLLVFFIRIFSPKKKVFILHHHYKFELMSGFKRAAFQFFEINFLRMATTIIIPSPYILAQTKQFLPSNKISYLEIAFEEHTTKERSQVKNEQMLFVGNIEYRKGIHLLIESLQLLKVHYKDFKMHIIGSVIEQGYYDNILQKINCYGLRQNVVFHGRVTNEEKAFFMKTSNVFVFPSLQEGYGMVIMEAMSFGLPVIAFNNSAIPYTVKDEYNGLIAANKDIDDLKQKIEMILKDSSLKEKLSQGAFETFSKSRKLPALIEEMKRFTEELKYN